MSNFTAIEVSSVNDIAVLDYGTDGDTPCVNIAAVVRGETPADRVRTSEEIESGNGLDHPDNPEGIDADTGMDNREKIEKDASSITILAQSWVRRFDGKAALRDHYLTGKDFVKHAKWEKKNFPEWNDKLYDKLIGRVETEILLISSVTSNDIRLKQDVRVYAFVECVKVFSPGIENVPYGTIVNKLLQKVTWSPIDLEGEVKQDWVGVLTEIGNRHVNGKMRPHEIDELLTATQEQIDANKKKRSKPDDPNAIARAENAKIVAKRQASVAKVGKAIAEAMTEGAIDGKDIADTVASVAKSFGVELPGKTALVPTGFDPATATINDIRAMMAAMFHHGKEDEIRAIAAIASKMVASYDASMVTV
jgi:hypothetical protein